MVYPSRYVTHRVLILVRGVTWNRILESCPIAGGVTEPRMWAAVRLNDQGNNRLWVIDRALHPRVWEVMNADL